MPNKVTKSPDYFGLMMNLSENVFVSFTPAEFNRKLNLAFNIEDSTSTPFKINFRWFHYDKPEDGSNFEKSYFISDSLANSK
ncbi:MAG: hypothetical protein R2766_10445 [Saprospiraceae bacterium]